jgi:uncharacterized protein YndB with AHSA1/START domain
MSDTTSITVDQFLAHPPRRVWQALVDPGLLSAWFMPNDFAPAVGHAFTFQRPKPNRELHFSDKIVCEVLEIQAEKQLSYSWTDAAYPGELDSTVTWTLESEGGGTRLVVEHRGFAADDPIHQKVRALMTGGWAIYLGERLAAHLERGTT